MTNSAFHYRDYFGLFVAALARGRARTFAAAAA
jgi:hypothetical protein